MKTFLKTAVPAVVNRKDSYDVRLNPFGDDDPDDNESTESDPQLAASVTSGSTVASTDASAVPATAATVTETVTPPSRMPLPSTKTADTTAY